MSKGQVRSRAWPFVVLGSAGAVVRVDQPAVEGALLDQVEVEADAVGVVWQRGGQAFVDEKRLRRLLRDPSVRVLHDYLGEVIEVRPDDRAAFWQHAQGLVDRSPMSDFVGSEFKDDARAHLLVVHEYC